MRITSVSNTKTPAEVAEERLREAHGAVGWFGGFGMVITSRNLDHLPTEETLRKMLRNAEAAIDLAVKARAWAAAERLVEVGRSVRHGPNGAQLMERDRLRREYEALKEKDDDR